jgi:hypothetical protein
MRLPSLFKANFNPNQPRIPIGNPGGGRWAPQGGITVTTSEGFLTGVSVIDDTSQNLSDTLLSVLQTLQRLPEMGPQLWGTIVHAAFANAVRWQNLPGIGFWNVERTFSFDDLDPHYGLAGSIRTDVVLENDQGEVIAIYDVKTGLKRMSVSRANELRAKSGAASSVPVFELNVERGITRKGVVHVHRHMCVSHIWRKP